MWYDHVQADIDAEAEAKRQQTRQTKLTPTQKTTVALGVAAATAAGGLTLLHALNKNDDKQQQR